MMITLWFFIVSDIMLNPVSQTNIAGYEVNKNQLFSKLRLQIYNPLELVFRKTENIEVAMTV